MAVERADGNMSQRMSLQDKVLSMGGVVFIYYVVCGGMLAANSSKHRLTVASPILAVISRQFHRRHTWLHLGAQSIWWNAQVGPAVSGRSKKRSPSTKSCWERGGLLTRVSANLALPASTSDNNHAMSGLHSTCYWLRSSRDTEERR